MNPHVCSLVHPAQQQSGVIYSTLQSSSPLPLKENGLCMLYSQTQDYRSNVLLCMYIYTILGPPPGVSCMAIVQVKETAITHLWTVKQH